ncbi:MAG: 4-(cytidine 5'-diphospho)-2-C-methyl-D-erythritol kinase [Lachnospiraceae bacterium]|nr:4-(cytidine 5'-diphospho)-2-C-methyl-D-erythritol kinase [Lachnospiraceae bacterium]
MDQLILKAYAKINLSLDVVRRRPDGYHDVKMIMQTVDLYDMITLEKAESGIHTAVKMGKSFTVENEETENTTNTLSEELPADENNLIYKAAKLIMESKNITEGVRIHLEKNIPIAAGMAGGSTDAAAVFRGMNQLFSLGMSTEELKAMAVKIGADVPYCIEGGTQLSEGIGEILTPIKGIPHFYLLIAKPEISVSTKYVYENLHLEGLLGHPDVDGMAESIKAGDLGGIVSRMENVLESVTVKKYPVIGEIREFMKKHGAENALMSGSGPTVFGVYKDRQRAEEAAELLNRENLAKQIFVTTIKVNEEVK